MPRDIHPIGRNHIENEPPVVARTPFSRYRFQAKLTLAMWPVQWPAMPAWLGAPGGYHDESRQRK